MPVQYWMIAAIVAVFGLALLGRTGFPRPSTRRAGRSSGPVWSEIPPLQPGESYDTTVKLVTLPNVPLADLWCQRLREQGIEAFYTDAGVAPYSGIYGGAAVNPGFPAEVWVGQHDAERALQLLRELG